MQPRKRWIALFVSLAVTLAHGAAVAQSRTCDASGGMFGVPTGSTDPTKDRVEATIWFVPSSTLRQLTDVIVTVEVFNLRDPLLGSTSKKQPLRW
jgi:hypothetical protein